MSLPLAATVRHSCAIMSDATVLLAARFHPLWPVIAGTTLGMMLADGPAVLLGARFAHRLPISAARWVAAAMFAALAIWVAIYGLGNHLP